MHQQSWNWEPGCTRQRLIWLSHPQPRQGERGLRTNGSCADGTLEPTAARGAGFRVAHTVSNSQKSHIWAVPSAAGKENAGLSSIWPAFLGCDPSLVPSPGLGRRDLRFHISVSEKGPQVGTQRCCSQTGTTQCKGCLTGHSLSRGV